jgi:hypothetical protein
MKSGVSSGQKFGAIEYEILGSNVAVHQVNLVADTDARRKAGTKK